ncbi:hypothetical protein [Stenotrophomonas maltophilia]
MDRFQTIAADVDAGQFRLLLKGELRQCAVEDPIVFQGVAHIDQNAQGGLALRFVCEAVTGPFDADDGLPEPPQGKAIAEHFHFDLSGINSDARLWTAERILVRLDRPSKDWGPLSKPDGFDVALGQIPKLATQHSTDIDETNRSHVAWIIKGELQSPRQWQPKAWTHEDREGPAWSIDHTKQGNTEIRFHAAADGFEAATRHFFRALSILTAQPLQHVCSATIIDGVERFSITPQRRHHEPKAILWIPPKFADGWDTLLVKWLESNRLADPQKEKSDGRAVQDVIYHYWYRLYKAYAVDIENGAQVVTSSIEGMAKRYFSHVAAALLTEREQEFTATQAALEQLDRKKHARTINILKGKIDNERRNRPDVGLLLDGLCHTKHITEQMVAAWGNLRNDAAHGDHLVKGSDDIQQFERDFFQCFELFKRLCLFAIGYDGPAQDFSVEGWPVLRNTIR